MDDTRFDALTRHLVSMTSRRRAMGAVVGGAASVALSRLSPPAGAKKKKKKCRNCLPCEKCSNGKCKSKPLGARCGISGVCTDFGSFRGCTCPSDTVFCNPSELENLQCCGHGQACQPDNTCGACPTDLSFCNGLTPSCGRLSTGEVCSCVTSVDGDDTCASFNFSGGACASDAECTARLERPSVCVDFCSACPCQNPSTNCMIKGCEG